MHWLAPNDHFDTILSTEEADNRFLERRHRLFLSPLILDWVEQIRMEGIISIISFMHDRDLRCYQQIDFHGLTFSRFLEYEGLMVRCIPWEDPAHSKTDPIVKRANLERIREMALEAYNQLPKPVLLVCSAGIDRSAPVGAYIWEKRGR